MGADVGGHLLKAQWPVAAFRDGQLNMHISHERQPVLSQTAEKKKPGADAEGS